MSIEHASATVSRPPKPGKKYFTLDEANRSLAYVSRVVRDLTACYARVLKIRQGIERPEIDQNQEHLEADYERAMEELGSLVDELNHVGVELKDFEKGLLDFPCIHESRAEVYLCWQLGEEKVHAWHEVDSGFKGRQDVELLKQH